MPHCSTWENPLIIAVLGVARGWLAALDNVLRRLAVQRCLQLPACSLIEYPSAPRTHNARTHALLRVIAVRWINHANYNQPYSCTELHIPLLNERAPAW